MGSFDPLRGVTNPTTSTYCSGTATTKGHSLSCQPLIHMGPGGTLGCGPCTQVMGGVVLTLVSGMYLPMVMGVGCIIITPYIDSYYYHISEYI